MEIIDKPFLITEYRNKIKKLQNNFQNTQEHEIEQLWKNKKLIKNYNIRKEMRKVLFNYFEWKYNIKISNKIILKIPYLKIKKEDLKQEIKKLLIIYPKYIRKIIFERIQIVFTKRKNIGDILCNHIKFSSKLSSNLANCCCQINCKDPKKHQIIKFDEIEFLSNSEKELLRLKDIPLPHSPNNFFNIKSSLTNMIIKIGKCITPEILSEIKRISYNITKTKKKEINNYIKEKDILKIKTKLRNWIIAPLDKNSSVFAIICSYLYRDMCF